MEGDIINDKYNVQTEINTNNLKAEEKDEQAVQREDFLKIYKKEEKK